MAENGIKGFPQKLPYLTLTGTGGLGVTQGGTGLSSGTSGGILGFTAATTLASSITLTANALVLGGGAGATPTPMTSLGITTTVLHGNAGGAPMFGAIVNADITNTTIDLTTKVTGLLPAANLVNSGVFTGDATTTFPALTIGNDAITTVKILNANVTAAKMVNAGVFTGDVTTTFPAITVGNLAITNAKIAAATIDLTTKVTGLLPIANGGTNIGSALNNSKTMISSAGTIIESLGYQTKSAAYTVAVTDHESTINVTAPATNTAMALITLPLVASTNKGLIVTIKKADSGVATGQQIPIACNVADGIDGSAVNADKVISNFVLTSNVVTITTGTHGYIVGQVVTVSPVGIGVSAAGTFQIATVPSSTTFTYAFTHANIGTGADTGTCISAQTWLTQQYSSITLQSTGTSGTAGWTVLRVNDWLSARDTSGQTIAANTAKVFQKIVVPPGEWDLTGIFECDATTTISTATTIAVYLSNVDPGPTPNQPADNNVNMLPPTTTSYITQFVPAFRAVVTAPQPWWVGAQLSATSGSNSSAYSRISGRRCR